MTNFLVAVEHPAGSDKENIKVTDDTEGFGPGLLAAYPIQTMEADSPAGAAYCYAKRHGLTDILITINLPDNSEEWWMHSNEAHRIDHRVDTIWEPEEEPLDEMGEFLVKVVTRFHDIARDGGDHVDAVADALAQEGFVVVKAERWQDMCDKVNDRLVATKDASSPLPTLFSVFISLEEMLPWELWDDETILSVLVDEAYGRWLIEEPDKAKRWEHHWEGFVTAKPNGYYVRLGAKKYVHA